MIVNGRSVAVRLSALHGCVQDSMKVHTPVLDQSLRSRPLRASVTSTDTNRYLERILRIFDFSVDSHHSES